jgi:hypothetical protein
MAPPWNRLAHKGLVPNWINWGKTNTPTRRRHNDEISGLNRKNRGFMPKAKLTTHQTGIKSK